MGIAASAALPNHDALLPLHAEFIEGGVIWDSTIQGNLWFSPTDFNGTDTITVKRVCIFSPAALCLQFPSSAEISSSSVAGSHSLPECQG